MGKSEIHMRNKFQDSKVKMDNNHSQRQMTKPQKENTDDIYLDKISRYERRPSY